MKEELTNFFSNIFDWLIDIKLNIHFGDDKTKSIPFYTKNRKKEIATLDLHITMMLKSGKIQK